MKNVRGGGGYRHTCNMVHMDHVNVHVDETDDAYLIVHEYVVFPHVSVVTKLGLHIVSVYSNSEQ